MKMKNRLHVKKSQPQAPQLMPQQQNVPLAASQSRADSWNNILTGLGYSQVDKRMSTVFNANLTLTEPELNAIFRNEGMGKRIIEVLTEDLTRKPFIVKGDTDSLISKEIRKIHGYARIIEATKWALLYGGSVGVIGIDDGGYYDEPVNEANIQKITHIHVFDRFRTIWTTSDLYSNPMSPKYGQPEYYTIFPINPATVGNSMLMYGPQRQQQPSAWGLIGKGKTSGDQPYNNPGLRGSMAPSVGAFRVHESRIMKFDGPLIPLRERISNRYWNDSYLQSVYERIRGLGEAYAGLETIISEFIIGSLQIENLAGMIASGQDGLAMARLSLLDRSKHIMNTLLMDKEETYNRQSASVSGLKELIDALVLGISCGAGIPVTVLFGQSPAGLSATGASDLRRYYDKIQGLQQQIMADPIEKLTRYIQLSKNSAFKGRELEDWQIEFPTLWSLTELEEADRRSKQASADAIYLDRGVVTPEEVAQSRFCGNSYSIETQLSNDRDIDKEIMKQVTVNPEEPGVDKKEEPKEQPKEVKQAEGQL